MQLESLYIYIECVYVEMTYYYYHYYNCIVLPLPLAIVLYEIYKYISLFVYVIIASLEIIYCTNCNNEIDIYN